MPEQKRPVT